MAKTVSQIREMMKQVQDESLFEQTSVKPKKNSLVDSINKNNLYTSASLIYSDMLKEEAKHNTQVQKQVVTEDCIKLAGALYAMKEVLSENITKENSIKLFQEINKIYKQL